MDATIVIPTKNGGNVLKKVLSMVFSQETSYSYEVICVDSGSTDNTLEIIKQFPCTLVNIKPSEFGHGKTRNYGASLGTGEFILFLTQDATPVDNRWLDNFLNAMKENPNAVGGFGIHYPYPDCNLFDKRDLKLHFKGFGDCNTVFKLEDKERYAKEEGYRHFLAFFSDNNSCLRRSVWEKYPYPDVNFAEDQIWARQMIELGFEKLYCPYAAVYHSHNYPVSEYWGRYYDEFKSIYNLHQFIIVKHWYYIPPAILKHFLNDTRYVLKQKIPFTSKLYWMHYSLWRNTARYISGFIGGKYHGFSPKKQAFFDKKLSQQLRQINK